MKKKHICVIDLIASAPAKTLYQRIMYPNFMSLMPQVIGVWCRQEGHNVTYILYAGLGKIIDELPEKIDIAFISAFTFTAHLAYAIGNLLRTRGTVTILGGPHARCYPEDSCKYFDYVIGLTDKNLIADLLVDAGQNHQGLFLTNSNQPIEIPGARERWEFIEKAWEQARFIKIVPMIASFGCPYKCDFCIDARIPYQQLDSEPIKADLRFLLHKLKRPKIGWYDPNFGIRFNDIMDIIEESVPSDRIDFIAECSLSILSEKNVKRLGKNGFKFLMPGIESWFGYGNKAGTGERAGVEKVIQVADQFNMIQQHIPYVHANFLLGTDGDEGPLPFDLTKRFLKLAPGVYPSYAMLNSYGSGAPSSIEYQLSNRLLPLPFHLLQSTLMINVRPKNYNWPEFYNYVINLLEYSFSTTALYNRFKSIKMNIPRWISLLMSITNGGSFKIKFYSEIRRRLLTDAHFMSYYEQETKELPLFFEELIRHDLGPFWQWLPKGALYHDPNIQAIPLKKNHVTSDDNS